jgi:predicted Holliday junction resolvase-like endonuclease
LLIRRIILQVFLLVVLAVTYYLVDYVINLRQEQVEKRREQVERAARASQVAKERWQRAGRKIITAIRKQNKLQGQAGPRPVARHECSSHELASEATAHSKIMRALAKTLCAPYTRD